MPVTDQWLNLGWARQQQIPDSEHLLLNTINPKAVVLLQQPKDVPPSPWNSDSKDWYPINIYDTREANMRELATAVKGKPEAEMGLKRAVIEHIRQQAGDKGIIGNPAVLKFLQKNRAALREVFSDAHLDTIEQLAEDSDFLLRAIEHGDASAILTMNPFNFIVAVIERSSAGAKSP